MRKVLLNDFTDTSELDRIVPNFLFEQATEPFMAEAQLFRWQYLGFTPY